MGLLVGFVFNSLRGALALIPWAVLHLPLKKIAAAIALVSASVYLVLSGVSVATERAFIMAAVMLGAVLVDRRAISLRAVALAAMIVLILRPESLLSPGFQMSFAATTALVAAFAALRDWRLAHAETIGRLPRWTTGLASVVLSSFVAGLATAPIAAAHFNQIARFGLLANLISVPVMGLIVMPGAVVATCLAPLGLADMGLWGMRLGISWILTVADQIAAWEGARIMTPAPRPLILPLLYLGALMTTFCIRHLRWAGLAMQVVALSLWMGQGRPPILVSQSGKLIGILGPEGRVLSRARGEGFPARAWLDADGDPASQARTAMRPRPIGGSVRHLPKRTGHEDVREACRNAVVVVTSARIPMADMPGCLVLDSTRLAMLGAVALYPGRDGPRVIGAARIAGDRLWTARDGQ
ncbi:MAG: ComEC/Rec2 family competence protein, partial [Pseudomonadota bacterium]